MLQITDTIGFLIWACIIGTCCAIVYTNIQRGAISKFINALVNQECFSENGAKTLGELGLCGNSLHVVKNAVKRQHGLKRIVGVVIGKQVEKDEMNVFSTKIETDNLYYLTDGDTEEILKKYSFKQMSAKHLVLFIAALLLLGYLTNIFADWMYRYITVPKLEQTEHINDQGKPVDNTDIESDDTENDGENSEHLTENGKSDDITDTVPTIPSSPSIPTLPTT